MSDIASVKPASPAAPTQAAGVSSLPSAVRVAASAPAPVRSSETLQKQLDAMLADSDTSLRFRVDDQANRIVVSVLDHEGDVILQVPSETALSIARRLAVTGSLLDARA